MDSAVQAVESLAQLRGRAGFPALAKAAGSHPSATVRSAAVQAIGRTGDDDAIETLSRIAYSDGEPAVQMKAVRALAATHPRTDLHRRQTPRSIERRLSAIADSHPNRLVRSSAAKELAGLAASS